MRNLPDQNREHIVLFHIAQWREPSMVGIMRTVFNPGMMSYAPFRTPDTLTKSRSDESSRSPTRTGITLVVLKKHLVVRVVRRHQDVNSKTHSNNVRGRHLRSLPNYLEHVSATQRPGLPRSRHSASTIPNKNPSWTLACTVPQKVGRYPDYPACADPKTSPQKPWLYSASHDRSITATPHARGRAAA